MALKRSMAALLVLPIGLCSLHGTAIGQIIPPESSIQTEADRSAWEAEDTSPKAVVDKFNQLAFFDGKPIEAIKKYISDDFIERNPDFANDDFATDKEAILNFFETRGWKEGEQNSDTIYQVIAEGDRVVVFHHVKMNPEDRGIAFVDIFRVKDGLIVEHWAVGQPVPDTVSPRHSMF